MKLIYLTSFSLLFALASCGNMKEIKNNGEGQTIRKTTKQLNPASLGYIPKNDDPIQIEKVKISGNTMILWVNYKGGCREHTLALVGSEMISKSMPPIRAIKLVHTKDTDQCQATVKHKLKFDIQKLAYKQEAGNQIKLNLEGYDKQILYTFK